MMLGSVTHRLARSAERPIILNGHLEPSQRPQRSVLKACGLDASPGFRLTAMFEFT